MKRKEKMSKKKKKVKNNSEIGDTFRSHENEDTDSPSETEQEDDVHPSKTIFSIRAFPIGGYVRMAGEDEASTDVNAFCNKAVWKRFNLKSQ